MSCYDIAARYNSRVFSDGQYRELLRLRTALRLFLHWSEEQAQAQGITGAQHQLLLAIRGSDDPKGPTVGALADSLVLKHHSVTGLLDRAQRNGLVERERDDEHHGTVRLRLTERGRDCLDALTGAHLAELAQLAPSLSPLVKLAEQGAEPSPQPLANTAG